jgi:predicted Zn-dependent peptidase
VQLCADAVPLPVPPSSAYRSEVLENGIRVVTELIPESRSASLGIVIDAGPADEADNQAGLAHLTEHSLFQGTSSRNAHQIAQFMDLAGGPLGGFTARDYTCCYGTVLADDFPYVLELLGDCLLNSIFPEDAVRREKQAILREIDACCDTPCERVQQLLKAHAWRGHALSRSITGRAETIGALSRDDIIYFLNNNYLPDRLIIAAAGCIDHDDFVAQVRDAFWSLRGESPGPRRSVPATHVNGLALEVVPLAQTYFALGIPAPAYAADERYGWHVLNALLGGGISSRLYRVLREERGLVYSVSSEYQAYRDAGLLVIEGSTSPEFLLNTLSTILIQVGRLALGLEPPEEEEVWRAQLQIRRQHLLAGESTNTRMSRLATQQLYFGTHIPSADVLASIEAVDRPALERLCANWLAPGSRQAACAVVGPEAPQDYSAEVLNDLLAGFR